MRLPVTMGLLALGSVLPIVSARAQEVSADSANFRAGQWGAEFSIGNSAGTPTGAAVLRFQSPHRALVLDLNGQLSRSSNAGAGSQNQAGVRVGLGSRWYRRASRQVLQSLTLGVLVARDQREVENAPPALTPLISKTRTSTTGVGTFAELGGSWLVRPQLSLGAAWQGNILYGRRTQRSVPNDASTSVDEERSTFVNASLGMLVLRLGVFF